jgi:hypothetical protein
MIAVAGCGIVKVAIYSIVPMAFTLRTNTFSLNTITTILVWLTFRKTSTNFNHSITVENLNDALRVEIAQHAGIASTTGFYVALRIDV